MKENTLKKYIHQMYFLNKEQLNSLKIFASMPKLFIDEKNKILTPHHEAHKNEGDRREIWITLKEQLFFIADTVNEKFSSVSQFVHPHKERETLKEREYYSAVACINESRQTDPECKISMISDIPRSLKALYIEYPHHSSSQQQQQGGWFSNNTQQFQQTETHTSNQQKHQIFVFQSRDFVEQKTMSLNDFFQWLPEVPASRKPNM